MSVESARTHAANGNWPMAAVEALPEGVFATVYRARTGHKLTHLPSGYWVLRADETAWRLPRAKDALRVTHIGDRPARRVVEKYLRGEVTVEPGDFVVDVGAMIGEFARQVPTDDVLALDVDPTNVSCLEANVDGRVKCVGAWCTDAERTVNLADDTSESSLLTLDAGNTESVTKTEVRRLDTLIDRPVDLLKVEAEGAEPEVLQGADGLDARQVVVDVSPERYGESPAPLCRSILEDRGYRVERYDDVLTAVQGDSNE